ncbi:MAG: hypothetical protein V4641_31285 [Pseudomonadota bacterium]
MPRLKLDRQTLALFLPNHQSIVAFEQIFNDVENNLPSGVEAATALATAAAALANLALQMVGRQEEQIEQLSFLPAVAQVEPDEPYTPALALGTLGQQNADSVEITGGAIDGTTVGATSASTGAFTTLTASGAVALSPANANVVMSPTGTGLVTIAPATAGSMNNVDIGATTARSVRGTTVTATGALKTGVTGTAGLVQIARSSDGVVAGTATMNANTLEIDNSAGDIVLFRGSVERIRATSTGATVAGTVGTTGEVRETQAVGGIYYGMWSSSGNASSRNWAIAMNYGVFGNWQLRIGNAVGADPDAAGVVVMEAKGTGVSITAAFSCNGKTPQTAVASGGALAAYAAGANGLSTGAEMSALHAMVVNIRATLVANGIMS